MQQNQATDHVGGGHFAPQPGDAYQKNHQLMLSVLEGAEESGAERVPGHMLRLRLDRMLVDRACGQLVPFDGELGVEALLEALAPLLPSFGRVEREGHLVGLEGSGSTRHDAAVGVRIGLGPAAQMVYDIGPTTSVVSVLQVLEGVDRRLHTASAALGCDYTLLAEGYNPLVASPLDVPLVPRTRWTLLNAHLGQTGRYARDMMRCLCSTVVSLGFSTESQTIAAYRLATALSPLLSFLTDNVRSFRGSGARRSPRMVRTLVMDEVDPSRTGVVPGTFGRDFSAGEYLGWVEGLQPILLEDPAGTATSTGKQTLAEVMGARPLLAAEAQGLLGCAMPMVRMGRGMELLAADALRPRLAAGYAAFIKGVFLHEPSLYSASALVGPVSDADVELATHELRLHGWDATVYGQRVVQLVDQLIRVARSSIDDERELAAMEELTELWDVRMVPRDAFVHQETKAQRGW